MILVESLCTLEREKVCGYTTRLVISFPLAEI